MKTPQKKEAGSDFQDSLHLRETQKSLRVLVKEAAARLKQERTESQAQRVGRGFWRGNGERFHTSRY